MEVEKQERCLLLRQTDEQFQDSDVPLQDAIFDEQISQYSNEVYSETFFKKTREMLKARITLFEDTNEQPLGAIHNSLTMHDRQNLLLGYQDINMSRDDGKQIIRSTSLNMR